MKGSVLPAESPLALAVVAAIQGGEVETLRRLLGENSGLASARIAGRPRERAEASRTLLHVATDWPGHFPRNAETVAALIAAGADVNGRVTGGPHTETPLHWAASTDDVEVLDVLLDAGADLEAEGAVIGGGTPLGDAVAFGQWQAARRLVERGARTTLWQAAALGRMDRVEACFAAENAPVPDEITKALWCACHGGQQSSAEFLLQRGADLHWIGYDGLTALDAARRSGATALVAWLQSRGARSAKEP